MLNKIIILLLLFALLPTEGAIRKAPAKKTAKVSTSKKKKTKAKPKPKPVIPRDLVLSKSAIFRNAQLAASNTARTKLPQIDILNLLYLTYKDDDRLVKNRSRIHITGENFGKAYSAGKRLFEKPASQSMAIQPAVKAPEIEYTNFQDIILSHVKGVSRLDIKMTKPYVQELPYTFGAKISIRSSAFGGRMRRGTQGKITEIIFDDHRAMIFKPPGIAFFLPDIYVKIASIVETKGETFGYVIGRPVNATDRFYAVRYNLTTCAKSSIKTYTLSPGQFKAKFANADFFGFAD